MRKSVKKRHDMTLYTPVALKHVHVNLEIGMTGTVTRNHKSLLEQCYGWPCALRCGLGGLLLPKALSGACYEASQSFFFAK